MTGRPAEADPRPQSTPAPAAPQPLREDGQRMTVRDLFQALALTALVGWLLVIGQQVLLPVVIAVMLSYVLVGAAKALQRARVLAGMPVWLSYAIPLIVCGAALITISVVSVANLREIARTELAYNENVLNVLGRIGATFGLAETPTWDGVRNFVQDRLDLPALSVSLLSLLASAGGYTVLISTYVVFMIAERGPLTRKMNLVIPDTPNRGAMLDIFERINDQVITYLSTKTLINIILGVISWMLMLVMGIENAVFWAFLIALFNYIPYVGSLIGVGVVVLYTALVTGDLQLTLLATVLLTTAQVYVGNWLEPRVMSRSLNLSPLTVLMALVLWATLWGLTGAIIAVPMTSILMIVLAEFKSTRPVAILASRDGDLA